MRNEEIDASRAVSGWIGRLITAPCRPYQPGEIDAEANGAEARRIGSQIAVLLKNDQEVLPLDAHAGSVVIIGQSAFVDDASLGGGGSSKVTALYTVAPLDGMRNVLDGLGSAAMVTKVTVADDLSNLDEAKQAAADADVVVPMVGLVATEGADQADPNMLHDQNRMLAELLGINPTTVVVLKDGNPVLMPWINAAPAAIEVWNQGTEDGHVVADLLFGVVSPSGKVPTWREPRGLDQTRERDLVSPTTRRARLDRCGTRHCANRSLGRKPCRRKRDECSLVRASTTQAGRTSIAQFKTPRLSLDSGSPFSSGRLRVTLAGSPTSCTRRWPHPTRAC